MKKIDFARRFFLLAFALLVFIVFPVSICNAQIQSKRKPFIKPKVANRHVFDHSKFDSLLKKYVANGKVDYAGFKKDIGLLDKYLNLIANANLKSYSKQEKLAFYINAYNAYTIKLIVNNLGRIKSIRDIKNPWKQKVWKVEHKIMSLDEIENKILRAKFQEPRIHFAIVCASIGCPPLSNKAYSGANIGEELTMATEHFVNSPKYIQLKGNKLYISKIFQWFAGDFKKSSGSVLKFIAKYASDSIKQKLMTGKVKIQYFNYNWALNIQ